MNIMLTIFLIIFIAIPDIATLTVFGKFISRKNTELYMNLEYGKDYSLNWFDHSILSTKTHISDVPFSFLCKYYIEGIGTVPRWSKLHKKINEYFEIARKNKLQ